MRTATLFLAGKKTFLNRLWILTIVLLTIRKACKLDRVLQVYTHVTKKRGFEIELNWQVLFNFFSTEMAEILVGYSRILIIA